MNNGKVRVLFGSTTMLGTGVNAQQRAVAVHHLEYLGDLLTWSNETVGQYAKATP